MSFNSTGVLHRIPAEQRLNVYALVIYIPDPLGRFLDDLRKELVPGCNPHAHVSVLPPRPIAVDWQVAGEQVRVCAGNWTPFEIKLEGIRIFPVTNVIYVELGQGAEEMFVYETHQGMIFGSHHDRKLPTCECLAPVPSHCPFRNPQRLVFSAVSHHALTFTECSQMDKILVE